MRLKNRKKFMKPPDEANTLQNGSNQWHLKPVIQNYQIFGLAFLSVLCFCNSYDGNFVFDDHPAILINKVVRQPHQLKDFFVNDFWGHPIRSPQSHKSFRPLTTITFALNHAFFGLSTRSYHAVNIALHSLVTLMVFGSTKKVLNLFGDVTSADVAFGCATLFAVHPIHTEAVANIVGRAELLMTVFVLLTINIYIDGLKERHFSYTRYTAILLTAQCSLLSKEQGIVALPMCAIIDVFEQIKPEASRQLHYSSVVKTDNVNKNFKKLNRNDLIHRISLLCLFILSLLIMRFSLSGFQTPSFSSLDNTSAFHPSILIRTINRAYLLLYHLFLLVYPVNLCFDYSMGCISLIDSIFDLRLYITLVCSITAVAMILLAIKHFETFRLELYAMLITAIAFFPASSILLTVGFTVAERVLYLPSFGFCLLCSLIYHRIPKDKKSEELIQFVVIVLLGLAFVKCITRSLEWRTEFTLYRSGLDVCPNNAKIHYNLGKLFAESGNWHAAKTNYQNALKLEPSYSFALNNLANINIQQQKFKEAEVLLKKCLKLQPQFPTAWMNLGIAYMGQKQYEKAEESFIKALKIRPHHVDCLYNIGNLYLQQGRKRDALSVWKNVTSLNRKHKYAWINLLILLDELGECNEVINLADKVLTAFPQTAPIYSQIGTCYAKLGSFQKAERHLLKALELEASERIHLKNLDVLYQRWNRVRPTAVLRKNCTPPNSDYESTAANIRSLKKLLARKTNYSYLP